MLDQQRRYNPMMQTCGVQQAGHGFHVLTKPIGPICNLDCGYCFYLEKEALYPDERKWAMSDGVLERYIEQYIAAQPGEDVYFAWQGGEPTLLGIEFYQRAIQLQRSHANGKRIFNALQTNGTLLDDAWCAFLAEHHFLVGLSIDGPAEMNDAYRVDKEGGGTFDAVMRGLALLKKHGVEFNTLTVVNRLNAEQPAKLYSFLKEIGSAYLQFIPLVERAAPAVGLQVCGRPLGQDPSASHSTSGLTVTGRSVEPAQYGNFLCDVFDVWVRRDVGGISVQIFEAALGNWMGLGSSLCVFAEKCGSAMAIEHNGDLYSCDHYVDPRYKLGNVMQSPLQEMARSAAQVKFGSDKFDTLPQYCRQCEVRFACNGECPRHRFILTPDGEAGLNYLCAAYKKFFRHVDPYMRTMGELLRGGQPAAGIMEILVGEEACA